MKKTITALLLGCFVHISAQQSDTLLQEVTVVDQRYSALQSTQFKVQQDSISKLLSPFNSVADWLPLESSVHIRQYAPGMAATYSAHGATSAQNAILWGGITINNPALGGGDLALLPQSFFIPSMLRGGSAALFGTAAMGSVLNLKQQPLKRGLRVNLSQQVASFSTLATTAGISYKGAKWATNTQLAFTRSENNYPFLHNAQHTPSVQEREHAAFNNLHVQQYIQYRLNSFQYFDATVWFSNAERQTPNSITVSKPGTAVLYDKTVRTNLGWHYQSARHKADVVVAYINEWQRFSDPELLDIHNNPTNDTNTNASIVARVDYAFEINKRLNWQSGLMHRYDQAGGSNRVGSQNTSSLQTGLNYRTPLVIAQLAVRAEVWAGSFLPISPFASIKTTLFKGFSLSAFGGYNYRVPSMNDRYWNPGGNPDLESEQGWGYEVAANYEWQQSKWRLNVRAAYYNSLVGNYILWVPSGAFWSPHNVRQVDLSGIDLNLDLRLQIFNSHLLQFKSGYAYNQSIVKASHQENDNSVGRQLTYQPQHKFTNSLVYTLKGISVGASHIYVGEVFTNFTTTGHPLASYNLYNGQAGYTFNIKKLTMSVIASCQNIFDVQYANIAYFPMPGRNYALTLKIAI